MEDRRLADRARVRRAAACKDVVDKHGGAALGALVSPHATLEELALAAQLVRGARHATTSTSGCGRRDFRGDGQGAGIPWLGMPVADLDALDRVLVVGSFLRKDHPLLAQRLRQAAKKGAQVSLLHSVDDDWLIRVAHAIVARRRCCRRRWRRSSSRRRRARASRCRPRSPASSRRRRGGDRREPAVGRAQGDPARQLRRAACRGVAAARARAGARRASTGATLGFLTEAANSVGGYLAGALPQSGRPERAGDARRRRARRTSCWTPSRSSTAPIRSRRARALEKADFVVVMSPFRHGTQYADVLLPIAPFTETAGTFVNCEGRVQAFNGVVKPLGETRPAWKVLRVLGSLLGLPGFDFDSDRRRARVAACGAATSRRSLAQRHARRDRDAGGRAVAGSSASPMCRSISPIRWCAARRRCSRPPMRGRRGRG